MTSATVRLVLAGLLLAPLARANAQETVKPALPTMGTLAGVVRDSGGRAMRDVQIVIPQLTRSTRSDAAGNFALDSIAPGTYDVWARSLGYIPAQFHWTATANARVEVAIKMKPLLHTLDPVEVWADEEKSMTLHSIVEGVVLDSAGNPIEGAHVALLGSGRTTLTNRAGGFIFRNAPSGPMTLRARLLGYAPAVSRFQLLENDDREVYLIMTPLAQTLDEVTVTAESGFGPGQAAWEEYDKRRRWQGTSPFSFIWGPEKLAEYGAQPLDLLMKGRLGLRSGPRGPTSIYAKESTASDPRMGDVCLLLNGTKPMKWPLQAFDASQIEAMEYYPAAPPETEPTTTVDYRFASLPECAATGGSHPAWYVLWLKGNRR